MEIKNNVKITFKGSKTLNISQDETKLCHFYSIKKTGRKQKSVNHHILLIDVSGSMYNEITELKNRLKLTLEALCESKNNYISMIIYSGHNECYRIVNGVKCDKTSYSMACVYETLENELYTRGITVMSEPLEQAIDIVKQLSTVCTKHHIALFTDGCLVPLKWSTIDEENKCYDIANICKDNNIYLNAIGFGSYYDRNFLKKLIEIPSNGNLMHIDEITDYYNTILSLINTVNDNTSINIQVENNDFYFLSTSQRYDEPTILNSLNSKSDNILITFDNYLKISDFEIKSIKKEVSDTLVDEFMYSLTLNHMLNGDIDNSELTIAQTGDIKIYKEVSNCYSFLEKGQIISRLNKCLSNVEERYLEGKESIEPISIDNEPICLLEVLREIQSDEKSQLLWDFKYPYKRIGMRKVQEEDRYKFLYDKTGYGRVVDLSIGSKKLNIGLKVEIVGEIQDTISKLKLDGKIFKDYNLVVNGNINTTELPCSLSRKLKMKLKKEGLLKKTIKWNGEPICILDLTKIKTTNKRLLKSLSQDKIATYLYDIEVLACKQWALNKTINTLLENSSNDKLFATEMCDEEIEARRTFRVNSKGIFTPLNTPTISDSPYEVYPAKVLEWKIEKFPKKRTQDSYLEEYSKLVTEDLKLSYLTLSSELSSVRKEKSYKQLLINLVRISSALIEKPVFLWDSEYEKPKREFDKVLDRNMVIDEKVVISTKVIGDASLRQDNYTVLTKCN